MTARSAGPTPGYVRHHDGDREALVVAAAAEWLSETLDAADTVYAWAVAAEQRDSARTDGGDRREGASGDQPPSSGIEQGRGRIRIVRAAAAGPDARERWAVRHYRRGGAVAAWLDDRYLALGPTRPEREIGASAAARARGIRTPAVIAGAWYRDGRWYRADLVTELVPAAITLADVLFSGTRNDTALEALAGAGRLVAGLGSSGIRHADLNATNVLVSTDPEAAGLWIVDLDRASVADPDDGRAARTMLARLERSLRKLGSVAERPLTDPEWSALRAGAGDGV